MTSVPLVDIHPGQRRIARFTSSRIWRILLSAKAAGAWDVATAQDGLEDRWPAAVLVATISGFICLAVWDATTARHATGYSIRIALPDARPLASGEALIPGPPAEEAGDSSSGILQAIAPEETETPGPSATRASPAFSYDLTDSYALYDVADSGGSSLEIAKPVRFNGVDAGSVSIRVSTGSALSIEGSGLARLFERAGRGDLAEQIRDSHGPARFIDFEEMRRQGFDVRYDARSDSIVISI
jgi:hypothetical protein